MNAGAPSARDQGLRFLQQGQFAASLDPLLRAVVEDPNDLDAYLYLGLAYAQQGEMEKSINVLEQAVDVSPTSAKAHYNLGVAYHKSHNITQAKDEYLKALGLDPQYEAAEKALDVIIAAQQRGDTALGGPLA